MFTRRVEEFRKRSCHPGAGIADCRIAGAARFLLTVSRMNPEQSRPDVCPDAVPEMKAAALTEARAAEVNLFI